MSADVQSLIPPPRYWMETSGVRRDQAENRTYALASIAKHGSTQQAIVSGEIDRVTLARYLNDGNFSEQLRQVEQAIASRLVANVAHIATSGKEENQLRATEFLLPALDTRFDPGVRRQQVANRGSLDSILLSKALENPEITVDPFRLVEPNPAISLETNVPLQGIEPESLGQGMDSPKVETPLEARTEPIDDYSI